jgi:hypothetical protein
MRPSASPLDVTRDDDVRWLGCLVWPDEGARAERLAAAIGAARRLPPTVIEGDLLTDLPALVAGAPADATVVVHHSSVLCYVTPAEREQFARTVRGLGVTWLTSEAPRDRARHRLAGRRRAGDRGGPRRPPARAGRQPRHHGALARLHWLG